MKKLNYAQAINEALREEMDRNAELFILGEDVCRPEGSDGAFRVTAGLPSLFPERVINTILNESVIAGLGAGIALRGGKAVVEMQFADFVTDAIKMIRNLIAGLYYRNSIPLSLVLRLPSGAPGSAGPFHSTCPEMLFFGEPGLIILAPGTPYEAKGLLKTAIRQDTPAIFIEWKRLYGMPVEKYPKELDLEIPDEDYTAPIGKARVLREGKDLTLISYGAMLFEALEAADILKEKNIFCEVIDLRSLMPFDFETVAGSVKKTGRLVVAHEDHEVGGYGGAFIQLMSQKFGLFDYLDAKPIVVGAKFTPHPHNPILENEYLPHASDIVNAVEKIFGEKTFAVHPVSAATETAPPTEKGNENPGDEIIPIPFGQKIIAEILTRQWERPHIHSDVEVNFRNIKIEIELGKEKFVEEARVKLTYTPFVAYALSRVLMQERFWKLRAYFEETKKENGEFDWAHPKDIKRRDFVNISIAVALESDDPEKDDGLLVPVIKNAHELSFVEMAKKISGLAEKCRNGKLMPDEQKDGVVTITNVGIYGVLRGNPILTETKQMTSIAVSEIKKNGIGILTLAFDHRMINGMLAGRFLQALKEYLENWEVDIFKN